MMEMMARSTRSDCNVGRCSCAAMRSTAFCSAPSISPPVVASAMMSGRARAASDSGSGVSYASSAMDGVVKACSASRWARASEREREGRPKGRAREGSDDPRKAPQTQGSTITACLAKQVGLAPTVGKGRSCTALVRGRHACREVATPARGGAGRVHSPPHSAGPASALRWPELVSTEVTVQ